MAKIFYNSPVSEGVDERSRHRGVRTQSVLVFFLQHTQKIEETLRHSTVDTLQPHRKRGSENHTAFAALQPVYFLLFFSFEKFGIRENKLPRELMGSACRIIFYSGCVDFFRLYFNPYTFEPPIYSAVLNPAASHISTFMPLFRPNHIVGTFIPS